MNEKAQLTHNFTFALVAIDEAPNHKLNTFLRAKAPYLGLELVEQADGKGFVVQTPVNEGEKAPYSTELYLHIIAFMKKHEITEFFSYVRTYSSISEGQNEDKVTINLETVDVIGMHVDGKYGVFEKLVETKVHPIKEIPNEN